MFNNAAFVNDDLSAYEQVGGYSLLFLIDNIPVKGGVVETQLLFHIFGPLISGRYQARYLLSGLAAVFRNP